MGAHDEWSENGWDHIAQDVLDWMSVDSDDADGGRPLVVLLVDVLVKLGQVEHSGNIKKFNSLRPRQEGRHFPDVFKFIFLNENI